MFLFFRKNGVPGNSMKEVVGILCLNERTQNPRRMTLDILTGYSGTVTGELMMYECCRRLPSVVVVVAVVVMMIASETVPVGQMTVILVPLSERHGE
jgi:hypothetical protein